MPFIGRNHMVFGQRMRHSDKRVLDTQGRSVSAIVVDRRTQGTCPTKTYVRVLSFVPLYKHVPLVILLEYASDQEFTSALESARPV